MSRFARLSLGLLLLLATSSPGAQSVDPPPSETDGAVPEASPTAGPIGGECEDEPPVAPQCAYYICLNGVWQRRTQTAGTSCDDGQACTHTDRCNANGVCVGTTVLCTGCSQCNGTATCGAKPNGSSCTAVQALTNSCSCSAGVCRASSSAPAQTAFCWDERGNMTAKFVVPPNTVCPAACP